MAIKTLHRSSGINDLMIVHILCGVALLSGLFITQNTLGLSIINQPVKAIGFLWAIEVPVLILAYSRFRASPQVCSVWWAIGRGLLSMPAGALVIAFGAIVFGAPLGLAYAGRTLHWSLLMSLFTVVPTATVFGISWPDWQRIFAHMKLLEGIDYALCFPAYGAVIGAWFGAWPMPLDWERPWQAQQEHIFFQQSSENCTYMLGASVVKNLGFSMSFLAWCILTGMANMCNLWYIRWVLIGFDGVGSCLYSVFEMVKGKE